MRVEDGTSRGSRGSGAAGSFVLAGVVSAVVVVLLLVFRGSLTWWTFVALGAGLVYATCFFRWGTRSAWRGMALMGVMVIVFIALAAPSLSPGFTPAAWLGGCLIGRGLGEGWRAALHRRLKPGGTAVTAQSVRGSATLEDALANELAGSDGGTWSEHVGDAALEVAGRAPHLLVCHRGHRHGRIMRWEVLSRVALPDGVVDVPMGGPVGRLPARLVMDATTALEVAEGWGTSPDFVPDGWCWEAGNVAEGTRLGD